jgi:hypothetical protein
MAQRTRSSTPVFPVALEDLARLKVALKDGFGISANQEEIASALIHGATVPQLVGMLMALNKDIEQTAHKPEAHDSGNRS